MKKLLFIPERILYLSIPDVRVLLKIKIRKNWSIQKKLALRKARRKKLWKKKRQLPTYLTHCRKSRRQQYMLLLVRLSKENLKMTKLKEELKK